MPNGPGDYGEGYGGHVPVPEAEAAAVIAKADAMITALEDVIADRDSNRNNRLVAWSAPNRAPWEEDFHLAQTDVFAAIDMLQAFKGDIESVLEAIRERNQSAMPPTPTGTTTTMPGAAS
jgi:hypothetical protein